MEARLKTVLALACLAGVAGTAQAQEVTLKVHHFLPPASYAHTQFIQPWCDRIAKESRQA